MLVILSHGQGSVHQALVFPESWAQTAWLQHPSNCNPAFLSLMICSLHGEACCAHSRCSVILRPMPRAELGSRNFGNGKVSADFRVLCLLLLTCSGNPAEINTQGAFQRLLVIPVGPTVSMVERRWHERPALQVKTASTHRQEK